MGGGVTTLELAKVIHTAINQNVSGLINVTNGDKICKYDLLNLFKDIFQKEDVIVKSIEGKNVDKSLVTTRADFNYKVSSYEQMVTDQFKYMNEKRELYLSFYTY